MSDYTYKKVSWEHREVHEFGGDGEYAGSFDKPDFINIQQAKDHPCVIAEHRKTHFWYWFRQSDTLLPWADLRSEGACEVDGDGYRRFIYSEYEGPFASEAAAKRFGVNHVRREMFDAKRNKIRTVERDKAHQSLSDLLDSIR